MSRFFETQQQFTGSSLFGASHTLAAEAMGASSDDLRRKPIQSLDHPQDVEEDGSGPDDVTTTHFGSSARRRGVQFQEGDEEIGPVEEALRDLFLRMAGVAEKLRRFFRRLWELFKELLGHLFPRLKLLLNLFGGLWDKAMALLDRLYEWLAGVLSDCWIWITVAEFEIPTGIRPGGYTEKVLKSWQLEKAITTVDKQRFAKGYEQFFEQKVGVDVFVVSNAAGHKGWRRNERLYESVKTTTERMTWNCRHIEGKLKWDVEYTVFTLQVCLPGLKLRLLEKERSEPGESTNRWIECELERTDTRIGLKKNRDIDDGADFPYMTPQQYRELANADVLLVLDD